MSILIQIRFPHINSLNVCREKQKMLEFESTWFLAPVVVRSRRTQQSAFWKQRRTPWGDLLALVKCRDSFLSTLDMQKARLGMELSSSSVPPGIYSVRIIHKTPFSALYRHVKHDRDTRCVAVEQPIASSKSNGSPVFRNRMTSPTSPVWSGGGGPPVGIGTGLVLPEVK